MDTFFLRARNQWLRIEIDPARQSGWNSTGLPYAIAERCDQIIRVRADGRGFLLKSQLFTVYGRIIPVEEMTMLALKAEIYNDKILFA